MAAQERCNMQIFKLFKPQDIFTFGNAACGAVSAVFSIRGEFKIAAILLLAAVLLDFLDGKVARLFNRPHPYGKELDSLADAVSFGFASAIFGYCLLEANSINRPFYTAVLVFFVLCGIARLARFNILNLKGYYLGIPITMNGLIFPIIYFAGLPLIYFPLVYALSGVLMISSFKVKKII